jgi:hypothetical protein
MLTWVYWAYATVVGVLGAITLALLYYDWQKTAVACLFLLIGGVCIVFARGLRHIEIRKTAQ